MASLEDLFTDALGSLGGLDRFVPGAALGLRAHKMARVAGIELRDELKSSRRTIIEVLSASPRFEVVERPNTDFLVRLRANDAPLIVGEQPQSLRITHPQNLRDDVYAAFTRKDKPFVYNKQSDLFYVLSSPQSFENDDDRIRIPAATQEQLVADRQDFADTLPEPLKDAVTATLHDERPLTAFKNILISRRLFDQWIGFHNQLLAPRIRAWAEANGVPVSDSWFKSTLSKGDYAFRNAVNKVIAAMSDDDLGEVTIPLKYIRLFLPR